MTTSIYNTQSGIGRSGPIIMAKCTIPTGIGPSGIITGNTVNNYVMGVQPGGGTLTFGATSGANIAVTSSGSAFLGTNIDLNKVITINDGSGTYKYATIVQFISTTAANVNITSAALASAGPWSNWYLARPFDTTYGPTGPHNIPGIWLYFIKSAFNGATQNSGAYWTVMTSPTVGTVFGTSAPTSNIPSITPTNSLAIGNTAIIANGSNAIFTQFTGNFCPASFPVATNLMGANGSCKWTLEYSADGDSGSNRYMQVQYAGLPNFQLGSTATAFGSVILNSPGVLQNARAFSQFVSTQYYPVGSTVANFVTGGAAQTFRSDYLGPNNTKWYMSVFGSLNNANDWVICKTFLTEFYPTP